MLELAKNWEEAQNDLKSKLGDTIFSTWIAPLKFSAVDSQNFNLEAPDQFFKDWVEKHYLGLIQDVLKNRGLNNLLIKLTVGNSQENLRASDETGKVNKSVPAAGFINLNSRYTFENFVVGSANRHAHAYSLAVANSPAKTYNPLFIYGGVGLGKTHLIQAICHQIKNNGPAGTKICYVSSEKFTNELIDAILHRTTSAFRQKYRSLDVLVIDDIHFIAGKESTQEEFFHTFNALYDAHKQIVFSSDRPPKEITNLQERLVSRFGWGLATDMQPPDLETRVAILKKKIEREPVAVPDDVIFFIAQLIKTNIRELEGALIRTIAYSLLEEEPVTLHLTKEVLKDLLKEPKKLITIDFIQRCVAEEFGVTLQELKTKRRNKQVVFPRQIAMYLSRELTDLSLPEIGELFGGKDHTTVLHSYKKIREDVYNNPELKERVEKVIQVIKQ
ncbi:MAG: chromosomal replication initiator protein DnaA [Candidatus Omnitrophica bacterium]|nr:chromosomal replication initiator protein DnaA [Candidatus Omnitrophota bacterium]MDD5690423.1 chromosomal replication initiator protein DnaA [Candidatus Omnitrophota bacterium]